MAQRVPAALETEIVFFLTRLLWQTTGLMLMGMALFKLGVLSAARSRAFYLRMAGFGFGAGLLLIALGLRRSVAMGWDLLDFVLASQQLHYWGDLLVALGWVALVMLLCQRGWPLRSVEAVGRIALTNYPCSRSSARRSSTATVSVSSAGWTGLASSRSSWESGRSSCWRRSRAPLLRRGAGRVADPLARVQTPAEPPARFAPRRRRLTAMRAGATTSASCRRPSSRGCTGRGRSRRSK